MSYLFKSSDESAEELLPCREEGRPSVFDRLTNGNNHRLEEGRTKMRMDSVPASLVDSGTLSYEDSEAAATPSIFVVGYLPSFQGHLTQITSIIVACKIYSFVMHCLYHLK